MGNTLVVEEKKRLWERMRASSEKRYEGGIISAIVSKEGTQEGKE